MVKNFLMVPITIYSSEEDVEKVRGVERKENEFDNIDEFLDYKNSLLEGDEPIFHQKDILLNIIEIESIVPIFDVGATEEDEAAGIFRSTLFTLRSGETYRCDWDMDKVKEELNDSQKTV